MQRIGNLFSGLALAVLGLVGLWALASSPSAGAAGTCDRVAAPGGSDAAAGSSAAPFRSAQRLVDSLANGQTGCFRNGLFDLNDAIEVRTPGVTLTSYPGERATVKGLLKIHNSANGVTVSDLNIDGRSPYKMGPVVYAANATFDNLDVTNYNTGICFVLGPNDPSYGRAVNTVIQDSRIHNCGVLPSQNGDHGIYVAHSTGAVIRNNWIYDNADRGIQLYPDSQGSRVYGNVIDGNGQGVIFSGDEESVSNNNLVYENVISNSRVRWNVESSWANGVIGSGNVLRDNCLWASNATAYYNGDGGVLAKDGATPGFAAYDNVIARPTFVNAAEGNFKLQGDRPCQGGARTVKLNAEEKKIQSGAKVELHGTATPASQKRVTIQILRKGHWKKFGRTRLRPSGQFELHKRLRAGQSAGRVRLRAKVRRVGRSKPVAIRVR